MEATVSQRPHVCEQEMNVLLCEPFHNLGEDVEQAEVSTVELLAVLVTWS